MSIKKLIVILGPTGIGKTSTSVEVAKNLSTEIISCDSRQFYKEMRIGTAVPTKKELLSVKHHFIQHLSINDYYNASKFEHEVLLLLSELYLKNNSVIMTGGSGLYIDAVCKGIDDIPTTDPELRNSLQKEFESKGIEYLRNLLKKLDPDYYSKVDLKNPMRMMKAIEVSIMTDRPYSRQLSGRGKKRPFDIIKIGLKMDRTALYDRINSRVDQMIEEGLEEEARQLYPLRGKSALNTVGYRELFDYFDGKHDLITAIELIKRNTRHYARRQITWFNRYDDIKWFDVTSMQHLKEYIKQITLQP